MAKLIITGHASYGTSIKNSLNMILGETTGIYYVDFNPEDNLETLKSKLQDAINQCGDESILFACDLLGGSPFRQCAIFCTENPEYITVAGLNLAAYAELVYNLDLSIEHLAELAMDTAHATITCYPDK